MRQVYNLAMDITNNNRLLKILKRVFGSEAKITFSEINGPLIVNANSILAKVNQNYLVCPKDIENFSFSFLASAFYCVKKQRRENVYLFYPGSNDGWIDILNKEKIPYVDISGKIVSYDTEPLELNSFLDFDIELGKVLYTKTTQLVAKFYLFNPKGAYTVREIAKKINVHPASVARANEVLHYLGTLNKNENATYTTYKLIGRELLLRKLDKYFINPFSFVKVMYLDELNEHLIRKSLLSGDSALSKFTSLSDIQHKKVIAMYKKDLVINYNIYLKFKIAKPTIAYEVQSFIYNPFIFAKDKYIDLLDLYIMTKNGPNSKDPRVKMAIEELRRAIIDA